VSHREIEEIAPGVWLGVPAPGEGCMGAVVGEHLTLYIDTTSYPPFASRFVATVEAQRPPAHRLLYITHRHYDHFAGSVAIDAPILAHRLTRAVLESYDPDWIARHVPGWVSKGLLIAELVGEPEVVIPQLTFEGPMTIDTGGLTVDLWHQGGHCAELSVAYVREHELFFGSDNVFSGRDPAIDHADVVTWIDALERIDLPLKTVVPGHGPVGGPELISGQVARLKEINLELMREGV
jgi:cyclase